jgi:hypothetical protein
LEPATGRQVELLDESVRVGGRRGAPGALTVAHFNL